MLMMMILQVCGAYEKAAFGKFYRLDGYLFRGNQLCVPNSSMRELLVCEAHRGGLMGHFGVKKTLDMFHEHFFWPKMECDVERVCARCITCRQAKSRVLPYGLYIPLPLLYGYFYGLCFKLASVKER
jgi:hypothetical protein